MKNFIYPACFYLEDNGQYSVIFPDFNGATYGNNIEDAYNMAVDILGGMIVSLQDDKENLPNPSDIQKVKADEYPNGFVSLVSVNTEVYRDNKAVKNY